MTEKTVRNEVAAVLKNSVIFEGASPELLASVAASDEIRLISVPKGDFLLTPSEFYQGVLFLLRGKAVVSKKEGGGDVLMSMLLPGSVFGAVTAFSQRPRYATYVQAVANCRAVLLPDTLLHTLFQQDVGIAENYIRYLSDRIFFLNRKIDGFTGSHIDQRLAMYLADHAVPAEEGHAVLLPFSLTDLASVLAVARASLYRSLEALEQQGVIRREGRMIHILQYAKLLQLEQ